MNKKEFMEILRDKTNLTEQECKIVNSVLENNFIIGKNNKEKITNELTEKLNIDYLKANNIYNVAIEIISTEIKYKLKHPFKSKD